MIYFYIFSIVIVAFAIIAFFAIRKDKQQKNLDNFRREKLKKDDEAYKAEQSKKIEKVANEIAEKSEPTKEIQSDALENFTLEKPVAVKTEELKKSDKQDDEDDDEESKSFEESFAEYERFLKENNIDLDDLEDDDDEEEKEEPKNEKVINLKDFEGKSRAEIMEMLSNYTEEEQKLILEELMGRKED